MGEVALGTRSKRVRLLGALSGAGLVVAGFTGFMLVHGSSAPRGAQAVAENVPPVVTPAGLAAKSGVRVVRVAVTGDGGLLDLRFQAVDTDRAAAVHDPATPPELVDEETGVVVNALLMGHQHKGRLKAGQIYYLIFNNPGNLVHRGGRVTVVLGDARLPHVRVE